MNSVAAYYAYKDMCEERNVPKGVTYIHYAPMVDKIFLHSYDGNGESIPEKKGKKWNRSYHGSLEFIGVFETNKIQDEK